MTIYQKLARIQNELIAPKGNYNSFGKYAYRSCEDILKALKPLCDEYKCVVFIQNDLEHIGNFNYVKATVTLADLESDSVIVSSAHAREEETKKGMDGSQITGASSSYARKYALAGLFCIDNEKDSDATNKGDGNQMSQEDVVEEAKLRAKILKYIGDNEEPKAVEKYIKKTYECCPNDMNKAQCEHFIKTLEANGKEIK